MIGTDLAVLPDTEAALPTTWDGLVAEGRLCLEYVRYGKIADLRFAQVCRAMLEGPGSKKDKDVADALGCSRGTVYRAVRVLDKITNCSSGTTDDLETVYDEAMHELRAREPSKSERKQVPSVPTEPDPEAETFEAELLPDWDIDHEQDEFRARQPGAGPIDNYTNEKALRDSVGSFCRIVADMASFVTDADQKKQLRESLIREIEAILR